MSDVKNYEPYKIPAKDSNRANESSYISSDLASSKKAPDSVSFDLQPFAEIEMDSAVNTSYKPALIPHPTQPVMDEKRRLFKSMRELSWDTQPFLYGNSKFYNRQVQYDTSKVFYKQAIFMKDFEDDYTEAAPFSSYFPYYQLMSYEQLRTYFTWRTKVRNGYIGSTSLSYVFVYIYELLNNIGVNDPVEGLDEIMSFWNAYKFYDTSIEKYLLKWIKDYHIYYRLPKSFKEFLYEYKLQYYFPDFAEYEPDKYLDFEYLSGISKYKIIQSPFYNDNTKQLISDCFHFVLSKLRCILTATGIEFKDLIIQPSKRKTAWTPFRGALFYPTLNQPDRQVVLSESEVYLCEQNKWFLNTISAVDSGRNLIGYIFKQMEAVLRKVTNYKYKLSANLASVNDEIQQMFRTSGSLEKLVTDSVLEFYREKNKIVISVNATALDKIRLEALDTQEKLIVPENDFIPMASDSYDSVLPKNIEPEEPLLQKPDKEMEAPPLPSSTSTVLSDGWTSLKYALNDIEMNALEVVLQGNMNIKHFADANGVMLEVLADSINEKAFDHIGDNILELDDSMTIYDEYREYIRIMVR